MAQENEDPIMSNESNIFGTITEEEKEEAKEQYEKGGLLAYQEYLQKKMEQWKKIPLNIGIIGNGGAGKSSFINAIRGLTGDDVGAAAVGVVETTQEPIPYPHPNNEMLKFWDLPGVGTPKFPKESYLEKIGFSRYDFFLIISHNRFTETDLWLGNQIAGYGKQFFFVRTKIHLDIINDKHDHPRTHNPTELLEKIKDNLIDNLKDLHNANKVFLIDNHDRKKYDFDLLEQTLIKDFPELKRRALILSMTVFSEAMVKTKANALRDHFWKLAGLSAVGALVPVPGFSVAVDITLLVSYSIFCFYQLGLDDKSLHKIATVTSSDQNRLRQIVHGRFPGTFFTNEGIKEMLINLPGASLTTLIEEASRLIPIIGPFVAAPISFGTTYAALTYILNVMEEVALKVVKEANKQLEDKNE